MTPRILNSIRMATVGFAALLVLSACSSQYREANVDISGDQLNEVLTEIEGRAGGTSGMSAFKEMQQDEATRAIFYSDSFGGFGPPESVISLVDFNVFGDDYDIFSIEEVKVIFIDQLMEVGRRNALLIDFKMAGSENYITKIFTGDNGSIQDGEFIVDVEDGAGNVLTLQSFDIVDDDFATVIQLRVYDYPDNSGEPAPLGKFPYLIGFQ